MAKVIMYTTRVCPYCVQAKKLLAQKDNIELTEIRIDEDPAQREEMMEKSGRRSVPQIFIGDEQDYHVGGFDDLVEHDMEGKLEALLED